MIKSEIFTIQYPNCWGVFSSIRISKVTHLWILSNSCLSLLLSSSNLGVIFFSSKYFFRHKSWTENKKGVKIKKSRLILMQMRQTPTFIQMKRSSSIPRWIVDESHWHEWRPRNRRNNLLFIVRWSTEANEHSFQVAASIMYLRGDGLSPPGTTLSWCVQRLREALDRKLNILEGPQRISQRHELILAAQYRFCLPHPLCGSIRLSIGSFQKLDFE